MAALKAAHNKSICGGKAMNNVIRVLLSLVAVTWAGIVSAEDPACVSIVFALLRPSQEQLPDLPVGKMDDPLR